MPEYARNKHGVIFIYPDVHDVEANMSHHHRLKSELKSRLGSLIDQDPVHAITEARNPDGAGLCLAQSPT
jgi:hypothetical protein